MNFQITNGLNKVSIRLSEIGSYFYFKKPLATVWHDCRGSVGKYLCLLPNDDAYKSEIKNKILANLNVDFTDNLQGLKDLLDPLLNTFNNGEYALNYYHSHNSTFFEYTSSRDDCAAIHQYDWFVMFANPINSSEYDLKMKEYEIYVEQIKGQNRYTCDILDFTTNRFYDGRCITFIATQPESEIDQERVKYFEAQIQNGERPFAIIFKCYFDYLNCNSEDTISDDTISDASFQSAHYVLDGHHKLLAYQNLGIKPSLAIITHRARTRAEIAFDIEALIDVLYPFQIEHILKNWEEKEEFILPYLKNPQSKIHNFIKNGHIKKYHTNGKIQHEAYYINDQIEGYAKWWFENGQLSATQIYKNGLRSGAWYNWYESGNLKHAQKFDELGRYDGRLVSYYENGQIQLQQLYKNGVNENGFSYLCWYEDGTKDAELKYLNGQMIERKNYNRKGVLTNFEVFDFEQNKLVKHK